MEINLKEINNASFFIFFILNLCGWSIMVNVDCR